MAERVIRDEILAKIEQAKSGGRAPMVVLDLDGTLYDNRPRTLRIIHEFAHEHAMAHPGLVERVSGLSASELAYKTADSLHAAGVTDEALIKDIERFWFERFFTDAYVIHDLPTPGAVEFVRALQDAGAIPTYLTGRDAPGMLIGTISALQRDGFPVGTVGTRVILKDDFETPDDTYKRSVVAHLRNSGEVVAVFDNEPGLCNLFQDSFPAATVVWLDTACAPGAPPLAPGIATLGDFRPIA